MLQYYFNPSTTISLLETKLKKKRWKDRSGLHILNTFSMLCIPECTKKLHQKEQLGLQHDNSFYFINQIDDFQATEDLLICGLYIIAFALSKMLFLSMKKTQQTKNP